MISDSINFSSIGVWTLPRTKDLRGHGTMRSSLAASSFLFPRRLHTAFAFARVAIVYFSVFVFHPNIPQFPITSSKTVSSPPHKLHVFQHNEKRIEHWRYCTSVSSGGFVRWGICLAQESKIGSLLESSGSASNSRIEGLMEVLTIKSRIRSFRDVEG
jgi:hypothetical protein